MQLGTWSPTDKCSFICSRAITSCMYAIYYNSVLQGETYFLNNFPWLIWLDRNTRVITVVFQTCLSYSLIAKLASCWNQAGNMLIQCIYLAPLIVSISLQYVVNICCILHALKIESIVQICFPPTNSLHCFSYNDCSLSRMITFRKKRDWK